MALGTEAPSTLPQEYAEKVVRLMGVAPGLGVLAYGLGDMSIAIEAKAQGGTVLGLDGRRKTVEAARALRIPSMTVDLLDCHGLVSRWNQVVICQPGDALIEEAIQMVVYSEQFLSPIGSWAAIVTPSTLNRQGWWLERLDKFLNAPGYEWDVHILGSGPEIKTLIWRKPIDQQGQQA